MGKFQTKQKSNGSYWQESIGLYRASKAVRILLRKFSLSQLSVVTGFSKNYICGVKEFSIKPSEEFLKKLERLQMEIKIKEMTKQEKLDELSEIFTEAAIRKLERMAEEELEKLRKANNEN